MKSGATPFDVRVASLLALLGHVEEQGRIVRQLLEAGEPILGGIEARLQEPQRKGREARHLAAPGDRLALELGDRHDGVHEAHVERLGGIVEPAQEPDLLGSLDADVAGEKPRAEAAVEAAHAGAGLAEAGVVGRDRQVADQMQDVSAAHRVAGDHRHDGLRGTADLHVEITDVEATDPLLGDLVVPHVAVVAAKALVAARAERFVAGAGEDDRGDLEVVPSLAERVAQLGERLRPKGVSNLRSVDGDLRDALGALVQDVLVPAHRAPLDWRIQRVLRGCVLVAGRHVRDYPCDPPEMSG